MKKILLFGLSLAFTLPMLADLTGNGYYRVQNAYTKRYCYLTDDKAKKDNGSTSADVGALQLYLGAENTISDPSTVFYVSKAPTGTYQYDISGQGTSIHSFLKMYMDVLAYGKYDGVTSYLIYGTDSGMVKYLGDRRTNMSSPQGLSSVDCKGDERRWYFDPINPATDQYFGITPTVEAEGRYYYPLYAAFPFSAYSEGLKFYTITKIDHRGAAVLKEITGTVPASTPVIVECGSRYSYANKFNLGGTAEAGAAAGNLLKGVYFNNDMQTHYNRVAYDKQTMRVLGVVDGRLAFVQGDIDYLPANRSYLKLTDASQYATPYFTVMTEEEYESGLGAVSEIAVDDTVDVYSLDGRLVKAGMLKGDVPSIGKGLYILRSGAASEKLIVR